MPKQLTKVPPPFGWVMLTLSTIYPVCVIGIEIVTGMCAETFFDPTPTLFHLLLVLFVPLTNAALWFKLRSRAKTNNRNLLWCSAVAITVAGYYTLIFLPILPLAAIGIMFMGLGLLPFAPLVSFICAIKLYRRLKQTEEEKQEGNNKHYFWKGMGLALVALILLDIPTAATYYGVELALSNDKEIHNRGIKILRTIADEDLLLRLSYDGDRQATGLLSFASLTTADKERFSPQKAREIFYEVTGEPFNQRPLPYDGHAWSNIDRFRFDNDLGGTEIGGRIEGLNITSSSLDGSISTEDKVVYIEWIMEFHNSTFTQQEARIQLALPPGAVVSRASLWVEGEEREAAFAGRAKVRQAYQSVVRTRRDPLLVTTAGTDRIMAQAFPIQPNGGTIKFKIGITAPLELHSLDETSFVLPAIVDRNFSFSNTFQHSLWFESKSPMALQIPGLKNEKLNSTLHRISGLIRDIDLSSQRSRLTLPKTSIDSPIAINSPLISSVDDKNVVRQEIVEYTPNFNGTLLIVIDGSIHVENFRESIISSLNKIPRGKKVGLLIASEELASLPVQNWSAHHQAQAVELIRRHKFSGGQNNVPALVTASKTLETFENAELLWIHAPQPVLFDGALAILEQTFERLTTLPRISLYSLKAGPNRLITQAKLELNSRTIPNVGNVEQDLSIYFSNLYTTLPQYKLHRTLLNNSHADGLKLEANASQHILRLWAYDTVLDLIKNNEHEKAIALAAEHQLVTPVSGAVVLESQQQYEDNDLNPVDKNSVPTIPEPRQWILAFITLVFLLWFLKRNNFNFARPI